MNDIADVLLTTVTAVKGIVLFIAALLNGARREGEALGRRIRAERDKERKQLESAHDKLGRL